MVRDLVNTPANLLGPVELADFAASLGRRYGATVEVIAGDALDEVYPTIAAVGRGSARPARVAVFRWSGTAAMPMRRLFHCAARAFVSIPEDMT